MKVEVAVLGSPSLKVLMDYVDVKQHDRRAQELCESRGGRPGLPVPKSPYGFCGRKTTLNPKSLRFRTAKGVGKGKVGVGNFHFCFHGTPSGGERTLPRQ